MAAVSNIGTLILHIHYAEHLMDVQTFGKQDPYVVVKCAKEKHKTRVCENGGRNPNWEMSFCFNLDGRDESLHFKVKDKEPTKDRMIGRADIPLRQILHPNGRKSITLVADNNFTKNAGVLWVTTTFTPGCNDHHHKNKDQKHQKGYVSNTGYPGNVAAPMPAPSSQYPGMVYQQQQPMPMPVSHYPPQQYAQQPMQMPVHQYPPQPYPQQPMQMPVGQYPPQQYSQQPMQMPVGQYPPQQYAQQPMPPSTTPITYPPHPQQQQQVPPAGYPPYGVSDLKLYITLHS
jgi:hypothetical protein